MRPKCSSRLVQGRRRRRPDEAASGGGTPVPDPTQAETTTDGDDDEELDSGVAKVLPPEGSPGRRSPEDLFHKTACLMCRHGGDLLVCSEVGCPIASHRKCLGCEPRFDESGGFYCPYCACKSMAAKVQKLRRKAILAGKKLNDFLNSVRDGEGGSKFQGERPRASGLPVCPSSHGRSEDNGSEEANGDGASRGSESIHHLSEKTTSSVDLAAGQQCKKQMSKPVAGPTFAASPLGDSSRGLNYEGNTRNETTEGTSGPQKMPQSSRASPSVERSSPQRTLPQKSVTRDSSRYKSNFRLRQPRQLMEADLPKQKRERLNWTAEEEAMLKEGVRMISSKANKNIQWRRILEHGCHVFHKSRTPADLKDKWKTMTRNRI